MKKLDISPDTDLNVIFNEGNIRKNENITSIKYETPIKKSIIKNKDLSKIIDTIQPIDFDDLLTIENAERNNKESKNYLKDDEKIVAILENLLEKADAISSGLISDNGFTLVFNGGRWQLINVELVKAFLSVVAEKSGMSRLLANTKKTICSLYDQFELTASSYIENDDNNVVKINLEGGTFHIYKDGVWELKPANKYDYFKYKLPFEYKPVATAKLFREYLDYVVPEKECQNVLMEYLAYILTKNLKLEKVLILYGEGSNGKSVFFEIVTALLGQQNVSTTDMSKLCDDGGYYRIDLAYKLLNYASEFGGKLGIPMFKKLISGEPIDARLPYGKPVEIRDYCKFMFNTNRLPEVEHTHGFFRRFLIVPFNQKIEKSKIDIHLSEKIISTELSGIFNMVLEGLDRLIKQEGFSTSVMMENQLEKYKNESNSVSLFLDDENWTISSNNKTKLHDLYADYRAYCINSGHRPVMRLNFSKRLKELGFEIQHKGTNNYTWVWIKKSTLDEEKDPFNTFIKPDKNIVDEILNNSKNSDDEKHNN